MNLVLVQIAVFVIMLVLFFVTARKDKSSISVKDVSLVAILCVMTVVLSKALSIKIPPAAPILVISLSSVVAISIGIIYSPKISLLAGLVIDIIGVLIAPATGDGSMPFLGFTLSSMLTCFIPSVTSRFFKYKSEKLVNITLLITTLIAIITIALIIFNNEALSLDNKNEIMLDSNLRLIILAGLIAIMFVIFIVSKFALTRIKDKVLIKSNVLILIILLEQIICSVVLTSFWINLMYGVPLIAAVGVRIIKMIISLPLFLVIIYVLLSFLEKRKIIQ